MALATRCPYCNATFRVAHDQLKLRAGLVRCGACKEIFNGTEHLVQPDAPAQAVVAPPASIPSASISPVTVSPVTAIPEEDHPLPAWLDQTKTKVATPSADIIKAPSEISFDAPPPIAHAPSNESIVPDPIVDAAPSALSALAAVPEPASPEVFASFDEFLTPAAVPVPDQKNETPQAAATPPTEEDPLLRMTLTDFKEAEPDAFAESEPKSMSGNDDTPDILMEAAESIAVEEPETASETSAPVMRTIGDFLNKPLPSAPTLATDEEQYDSLSEELDEPDFVKRGRRKQKISRITRVVMRSASLILFFGLLGQGSYAFRNELAARFPTAKPILSQACAIIGCHVTLPSRIDAVSIESSELQTLTAKNTLLLTLLLRNQSPLPQAWPNIELTLNDADKKAVARKVFTPHDYLPSTQDPVKGFGSASEQPLKLFFTFSQLQPSDYTVYLFYP